MANRLVSVNDNYELPAEVQEQLVGPVRDEFQTLTTQAQSAETAASSSATTASDAATSAAGSAATATAAAETATAPADTAVSGFVSDTGSQTRTALNTVLAPINSSVTTLNGQVAALSVMKMSAGKATVAAVGSGGFISVSVTYPTGRFTVAPIVTQATGNSRLTTSVLSPTATGFVYGIHNHTGAASDACDVYWTAVQMTATTAAG